MLAKIKQKVSDIYDKKDHLRDVRVLGLLLFLVIVLMISWSGVKVIQANYALQKQIATLTQENQVQQLQNSDLKLKNNYFGTNQYLELAARQNLGLGAAGETELLVPRDVALAQLAPIAAPSQTSEKPNSQQSRYEHNFRAWMDFIFHRQSSND